MDKQTSLVIGQLTIEPKKHIKQRIKKKETIQMPFGLTDRTTDQLNYILDPQRK